MKMLRATLLLAALSTTALTTAPAFAETVLRLDEAPVGELDPGKASDYADSILMFNVYDTLVVPTAGKPGMQPHLASSWTVDGNVYTFTLRDDVKFHSGNKLTADDVVYSFDRMIALGQGFSNLFVEDVEKAEAVDAKTVRFTLKGPYAPFLSALVRLPILDSKLAKQHQAAGKYGAFGDYSEAWLSANDAGSGAYVVETQNPQSETALAKFQDYFLGATPKSPDKVRFRYGLEASTVRALLSKGEHDIGSQWLPPEVAKALAADDKMQLLTETGTNVFYIKLNTAKAPLDDVHCRRALTYAFDYATAAKMVAVSDTVSLGKPANGPIPHGMLGSSSEVPNYAQDLEKAKAELAQCKYKPEETPLEISWIAEVPLEERFALLMQANFSKLGFKPEVKRVPWALFTDMVTKPETTPNISQIFNSATTPDPDSLLFNTYHSSAKGTWQSPEYLQDAEVDNLLEAGRAEVDSAKRQKIYEDLSQRLRDLAPTIYAYDQVAVFPARKAVTVPALSDDAHRYALSGYSFSFREMEMAP
ncbi:MAG TPA: ABC transporter substrate-binding protein [Kaistia sp.]|jgi:peptide/nickel transport system substrate-binding protein|nr:ABC transporter substrate-binding protein [Kaistia sp.]